MFINLGQFNLFASPEVRRKAAVEVFYTGWGHTPNAVNAVNASKQALNYWRLYLPLYLPSVMSSPVIYWIFPTARMLRASGDNSESRADGINVFFQSCAPLNVSPNLHPAGQDVVDASLSHDSTPPQMSPHAVTARQRFPLTRERLCCRELDMYSITQAAPTLEYKETLHFLSFLPSRTDCCNAELLNFSQLWRLDSLCSK